MCHHTREPTVLSRVSCRPFHLNIDRFHQPCLLPGRTSRIGKDCRSRTTWRPLTLFLGQPGSSYFASHWRFLPCRLDGTTAGCQFILLFCGATLTGLCLHTRRFGTLASPPPLVTDLLWGPHPLGHPSSFFSGVTLNLDSNSWTLLQSCNVVNPGKIFHSNSIGSPSILSKALYCGELLNHVNLSSHAMFDCGFSFTFPRHNTESEST